eukprot:TRINITY_DN188_c0_g1_i5.p1 TRINITY_DN188_c0_g1~~TRINITY_DN188_c0_g1_i5.p1  ORF type:complete len:321 (+),score=45.22 TRINITY_DN188_c0_g1_i5:1-963(+)
MGQGGQVWQGTANMGQGPILRSGFAAPCQCMGAQGDFFASPPLVNPPLVNPPLVNPPLVNPPLVNPPQAPFANPAQEDLLNLDFSMGPQASFGNPQIPQSSLSRMLSSLRRGESFQSVTGILKSLEDVGGETELRGEHEHGEHGEHKEQGEGSEMGNLGGGGSKVVVTAQTEGHRVEQVGRVVAAQTEGHRVEQVGRVVAAQTEGHRVEQVGRVVAAQTEGHRVEQGGRVVAAQTEGHQVKTVVEQVVVHMERHRVERMGHGHRVEQSQANILQTIHREVKRLKRSNVKSAVRCVPNEQDKLILRHIQASLEQLRDKNRR